MADVDNSLTRIPLGSGKLYAVEFSGTIPEDTTFETDSNLLGKVKGGASLEYKPKFYTEEDDLATVSRTIITEEEVKLKAGILTWNGKTLSKLVSTARVSTDSDKHTRTVKIGGIANYDGKKYAIRFINDDKEYGKTRITIVGSNQAGFTIAYAKDKGTVINPEFLAEACDSEGTKIIYTEEIPQSSEASQQNNADS